MLKTTSVATAGKVMAQLGDVHGAKMAKLLAEMPMYRAGAILGELDGRLMRACSFQLPSMSRILFLETLVFFCHCLFSASQYDFLYVSDVSGN